MSRSSSSLVLDGQTIKARLLAERQETGTNVHIDWLRFTAPLRCVPVPDLSDPVQIFDNQWLAETRMPRIEKLLRDLPDCEFKGSAHSFTPEQKGAASQAFNLGAAVCDALGEDFKMAMELRKGQDFYKFRWSIFRGEAECGWIGFLSSSDSPRQQAQNQSIHCNLFGMACTFAEAGWRQRMTKVMEHVAAKITRVDLALDFFDGVPGGMDWIVEQYRSGACDVRGKQPSCNMIGDWVHGQARSFYFGSKEGGKQTNAYEKGDQLFGVEAASDWIRFELRYGNKLRDLPLDILSRPADFFGGASDFHQCLLVLGDELVLPSPVVCRERLAVTTVGAQLYKSLKWIRDTGGASVAMIFHEFPEFLLTVVGTTNRPRALEKFSELERATAFDFLRESFAMVDSGGRAFDAH